MVSRSRSATDRQFDRRLVARGDRKLIESTCRRCGVIIVGSISDSLTEDEENHVKDCRGQRAASNGHNADSSGNAPEANDGGH